ncbi:MAG: hypothetical protein Kow0069_15160 [Promethearchaeota archaeon]
MSRLNVTFLPYGLGPTAPVSVTVEVGEDEPFSRAVELALGRLREASPCSFPRACHASTNSADLPLEPGELDEPAGVVVARHGGAFALRPRRGEEDRSGEQR